MLVDDSLEKPMRSWDEAEANAMSATQRGLCLLESSRLVTLKRIMRAAGDKPFADMQHSLRRTDVEAKISPDFVKSLRAVSVTDTNNDPSWMFAPIAVLSHVERDNLNLRQIYDLVNLLSSGVSKSVTWPKNIFPKS